MKKPGERSLITEVFLEEIEVLAEVIEEVLEEHAIPFLQEKLTRRQQRARLAKMEIPDMLGLIAQALSSGQGLEGIQTMIDSFGPREK